MARDHAPAGMNPVVPPFASVSVYVSGIDSADHVPKQFSQVTPFDLL